MKVKDSATQLPVEKLRLVNSTLSILLACSSSAKRAALDGMLIIIMS